MTKQTPDTMRLTGAHLDEIRASVDWQALFAGLGLRKAEAKSKAHDWWAFSPFHEEKTPSFHMAPGGVWYDFSIGEGGGPIELVQRLEGGNCYEAGRRILDAGWAQVPVTPSLPVTTRRDRVQRSVTTVVTGSVTGVDGCDTLANAPIRQDLIALCGYHDVLAERGISEETCELLGIGFLPQGRSPLKGRIVFQVADARPCIHGDPAVRDASMRARPRGRGASMAQSEADASSKLSHQPMARVILSHLGRALEDTTEPKYLFYQGFHKSAELYGQELIWLHEDAADQIAQTGAIVLTEGPFDVAKAVEAGLRNVVGSFGANLSEAQAAKLVQMAHAFDANEVRVAYDRDTAGQSGAAKAAKMLERAGVEVTIFDWTAQIGRTAQGPVHIPETVGDLGDLSTEQIQWLRGRGLL